MRPELETYHLIDRYLRGELQGEELLSFESEMKSNSEIREEVDFQQLVNQVVKGTSSDRLRERMSIDIKKLDQKKANLKYGLIGATLVLLIGTASLFYLKKNKVETKISNLSTVNQLVVKDNASIDLVEKIKPKVNASTTELKANVNTSEKRVLVQKNTNQQQVLAIQEVVADAVVKKQMLEKVAVIEKVAIPVKPAIIDPCAGVTITAFPIIQPTCAGDARGKVLYTEAEITGGSSPYSIKLGKSGSKEAFYNLEAGKHDFKIVDAKGCSQELSIIVPEKNCKENKFTFNPDNGEMRKVPAEKSSDFTLFIHNRRGEPIFKKQLSAGFEWDGTDSNGALLESGMYLYVIEYSDGNKENGQITIIR